MRLSSGFCSRASASQLDGAPVTRAGPSSFGVSKVVSAGRDRVRDRAAPSTRSARTKSPQELLGSRHMLACDRFEHSRQRELPIDHGDLPPEPGLRLRQGVLARECARLCYVLAKPTPAPGWEGLLRPDLKAAHRMSVEREGVDEDVRVLEPDHGILPAPRGTCSVSGSSNAEAEVASAASRSGTHSTFPPAVRVLFAVVMSSPPCPIPATPLGAGQIRVQPMGRAILLRHSKKGAEIQLSRYRRSWPQQPGSGDVLGPSRLQSSDWTGHRRRMRRLTGENGRYFEPRASGSTPKRRSKR